MVTQFCDSRHNIKILTPTEKMWALVKNWVASKKVMFKTMDIIKLVEEKFSTFGDEE